MDLFHVLAQAGGPPVEVLIDSSAVKAHRSASGGKGGEKSGDRSLARLPPCEILHGDKGYDSNAIRRQVEKDGAMPNIPPKVNRK